jgi:adenylate cyclase
MKHAKQYAELNADVATSEFKRTRFTIGVLLVGLVVGILNYFTLDESIFNFYGGQSNYRITIGWVALFIVYELLVLRIRKYHLANGASIPLALRVLHILIETSFPTLLVLFNVSNGTVQFLDSPITVVYYIFIVLSILCLDFKLSLLTGLVASGGFLISVWYRFHADGVEGYPISIPENSYLLRTILMLATAIAAGLVAVEVKKWIINSYDITRSKAQIENLFGQQVSPEVYRALTDGTGSVKKREATVLALDIRNFSTFAEQHTPSEIMQYQNNVFAPILDIVGQHQGVVNQIMGDGVMATFGAPVENKEHTEMAFKAALLIQKEVKRLSDNSLIPFTRIGIGLHTGEVVTGNIGNDQRKQFSISGTAVIIAFRVEQLNKDFGTDLLFTEEVKNKVAAENTIVKNHGLVSLKGLGKSVTIYSIP